MSRMNRMRRAAQLVASLCTAPVLVLVLISVLGPCLEICAAYRFWNGVHPGVLVPPEGWEAEGGDVDAALSELPEGAVVFTLPDTMRLGETVFAQLLISTKLSEVELEPLLTSKGRVHHERLRLGDIMGAKLTSRGLDIRAVTPEEQAVSESGVTAWEWEITPVVEGKHEVLTALSFVLQLDSGRSLRLAGSFGTPITVQLLLGDRVRRFVGRHWPWMCTAVLIPLLCWAVKGRRKQGPSGAD